MKSLIVLLPLLAAFLTTSCLDDDSAPQVDYLYAPITEVDMPDSARFGSTVRINTTVEILKDCQQIATYDYKGEGETREVAAIVAQYSNQTCGDSISVKPGLNFVAPREGNYMFKFWSGKTAEEEDLYITKEIVIY